MTVLSDADIREYLLSKKIVIHPILSRDQIQGAKIDLRLSNIVYLIKHFEQPFYDPKTMGVEVEYGEQRDISFGDGIEEAPSYPWRRDQGGFILQPGDFAIAPLFERVKLPNNIIGRLDGRSSLGRLGIIVHATAGGIDPGYSGQITCELSNLGKVPVALYPLLRIAALTLETISSPSERNYRTRADKKYKDQLYTLLSEDYELKHKVLDYIARKL